MNQQDNTIPLTKAKAWTKKWRSENKGKWCNAFLIPAENLSAVLAEMENQPGKKMARTYLGINPKTKEQQLIIVATVPETQKGGSIIYRDIINGNVDGDDDSGIYDITKPCPPECDPLSPLNNG